MYRGGEMSLGLIKEEDFMDDDEFHKSNIDNFQTQPLGRTFDRSSTLLPSTSFVPKSP